MKKVYEHVQAEKLKQIVTHAFENFTYYRKKMNEVGVNPNDIQGLEDLNKLPYTTGTTSTPMPVYYTHDDFERWEKNLRKGLLMAGITNKDVVQITLGRCGIACVVLLGAIRRTGATGISV